MSRHDELAFDVIERALDGDRAAFSQLFLRYNPTVRWAVGLRVNRWPELVPFFDDIVQEVWLQLTRRDFKLLRYYKNDRGAPFSRFLAVISTRIGWKVAKRHLRNPEVRFDAELDTDLEDEDWSFVARIIHADFLDRLAVLARERLDEKDYRLFTDHFVRGDKIKDIGARLGMNENTAHQRKRRLQQKLADLAGELLDPRPPRSNPGLIVATLVIFVLLADNRLGLDAETDNQEATDE